MKDNLVFVSGYPDGVGELLTSRVSLGCEAISADFLRFLQEDGEEGIDTDKPPEESKDVDTGQQANRRDTDEDLCNCRAGL
jgi:hypothetical protein